MTSRSCCSPRPPIGTGATGWCRVEAHGRELGARRVWLETSTINVPGIAAYARLGYTLCGADATFYEATYAEGEAAIYLSKAL